MNRYAIFNKQKNRFWSANSAGYTDDINDLGQYPQERASELLKAASENGVGLEAFDMRSVHKHPLFKKPRKPEGKRGYSDYIENEPHD